MHQIFLQEPDRKELQSCRLIRNKNNHHIKDKRIVLCQAPAALAFNMNSNF